MDIILDRWMSVKLEFAYASSPSKSLQPGREMLLNYFDRTSHSQSDSRPSMSVTMDYELTIHVFTIQSQGGSSWPQAYPYVFLQDESRNT